MSIAVQEQSGRPFRVPGYAGYVPGLKYSFGHTYGYSESRLFKSQHPNLKQDSYSPKITPYQEINEVDDACIHQNGILNKLSKVEDRKVQWTDKEGQQHGMDSVDPLNDASVQFSIDENCSKNEEGEGLRSAATQWSDQETHGKKKYSAATQWSPADFSPLKTIPGYTGHLPGRHSVNPGKTFCQEIDALLTNFRPKSEVVVPISRYNFTSALQQMTSNKLEEKDDPYFNNRPPSTYLNNYTIPGYQGFIPRVRTSTSSLGIRYIKAVEKSLHSLHEQQRNKVEEEDEELANSPKKLLEKRPLHTPRHRPHPKPKTLSEDDWRLVYKRPPSTYLDSTRIYIPGYKGFIPHLRGSPNAVGIRYSKAALRCVEASLKSTEKSEAAIPKNSKTYTDEAANVKDAQEGVKDDTENVDKIQDYGDDSDDSDNGVEDEMPHGLYTENNYLERKMSEERPYKEQHSNYKQNRKPSTYKSDDRHPIPGYQGFVPRLRDSSTTLGLRYTKAALKTLEDVHRNQQKT